MTTIPATTSQVASQTTNNSSSSSSSSTGVDNSTIAGNFQTFLQLLTTQLQNQNPLDPLDTNQFTQQLVQFAGVEQQFGPETQTVGGDQMCRNAAHMLHRPFGRQDR